ncbi:MAG: maleylpyruvate isomerase family mycothiol-dependent enzyme [Nocardioidaceae bacterium]
MTSPVDAVPASVQLRRFVTAAEQFVVGIERCDLSARVPACPEWTAYDLITHLGNVHAWAATIVETGLPAGEQDDAPRRKPKAAAQWYAGKAEDLYEVLRAADVDAPCWNFAFGNDGVKGFWHRRQLHETTVHALDLYQAARLPDVELSADLAADGVDEVLTVFLRRMHSRGFPAQLTAPVVVEARDVGRSWTVRPDASGPPLVTPGSVAGADVLRGPAADLYPLLWKRVRLDQTGVELVGDRGRLAAFLGSRLTA